MARKKKKIDLKKRSSGGAEHKSKKRPSTIGKHERGAARKQQDYGGEKADTRPPVSAEETERLESSLAAGVE